MPKVMVVEPRSNEFERGEEACVIGSRGSSLAMCQAQLVQTKLEEQFPARLFTLKTIKTQADKSPDLSLSAIGGEGVFVKELEQALLEKQIDLAVHSLKDLPLDIPQALCIAAVLKRDEPRDALVSRSGSSLDELPRGSRVGTSSLRRRSQLLHHRGDLKAVDIRGNVDTRLRKLDESYCDAIIVAACGLIRLGIEERITEYIELSVMLPEPGQGALAVEIRSDDQKMIEMLGSLNDPISRSCVDAERAFLSALGGGCRVPIAAYASLRDETLELEGAVVAIDGRAHARGRLTGPMTEPIALGERLAKQLTEQGARRLLSRTLA
jgi:hydroxymethylbilane synthase